MINPDKIVRTAYMNALASISCPVWSKKIPKDVKPLPKTYVLITSQTKNRTALDKGGFEWLCTLNFDIVHINESGYSNTDIVNDIEQEIINIVESEVSFLPFINKETNLIGSTPLDSEAPSQSIERQVLTYEHWLDNVD